MKKNKIFIESLGCDKNLVDSEVMIGMLQQKGYLITMDPAEATIGIVNTCSFIHDAKQESINTIIEIGQLKQQGQLKNLIVVGCLSELYKQELLKEMPEIDAVLGATNYDYIVEAVEFLEGNDQPEKTHAVGQEKYIRFDSTDHTPEVYIDRALETTKHYAYLKVAEGCDNRCTYCIIPSLRGKFRSRTIESLIQEVKYLVAEDKREIILVAQDVGKYGIDLYQKPMLAELLSQIGAVDGVEWIRLLYVYPEDVSDSLIAEMTANPKVLPYIDMPMQHINDQILRRMARKTRAGQMEQIINKLRQAMPDICIRTTFIVGFPGETEVEFQELYDFIERIQLDRVGVFTYSREDGTPAAKMDNQVAEKVSLDRKDRLMQLQQEVSYQKNQALIGKQLPVVIDGFVPKDNIYLARTYRDTPEIDSYVFVESDRMLLSGDYEMIEVTGANEYDLIGRLID